MNLSLIWRKENMRWCCLVPVSGWICFKAVKSSSQSTVFPSTPLHVKYLGVHLDPTLNFETHCQKIYKKAAGRVNLLRRIRSSIYTFTAQRIYQSMIMPIFTYCGYTSLWWSESRKRMIRSIETRSLEIISPKCSSHNCDLRLLTVDNFLQKRACCFVFDCLNGAACMLSI